MILCDLLRDDIFYYFYIIFERLRWNYSVTRVCKFMLLYMYTFFSFLVWFFVLIKPKRKKLYTCITTLKLLHTHSCYRILPYIYIFPFWFGSLYFVSFFCMMTWYTVTEVSFHYTSLYKVHISQIH